MRFARRWRREWRTEPVEGAIFTLVGFFVVAAILFVPFVVWVDWLGWFGVPVGVLVWVLFVVVFWGLVSWFRGAE